MNKKSALYEIWKDLSGRQRRFLTLLYTNEYGLDLDSIALGLQISTKTAKTDLAAIEILISQTETEIIKKPGVGLILKTSNKEDIEFLRRECSKAKILLLDERKLFIAKQLLLAGKGLTEVELEEKLFVSRSSIRNELAVLASWFGKFHLTIEKRKNLGIYLKGDELGYRQALTVLFQNECALQEGQLPISNYALKINPVHQSTLQSLYPGFDSQPVEQVLSDLEQSQARYLQEGVYVALWFSICTGIYRMRTGHPVQISPAQYPELYEQPNNEAASEAISALQSKYQMQFPLPEYAFLFMQLKASGILNPNVSELDSNIYPNFKQFRFDVIHNMETIFNIDFSQDQELLRDFSNHLLCTVLRLRYGIYITNPLLQEIKKNYSSIWGATWSCSVLFETYYNLKITEDEIGFLAMYVGIAVKRIQSMVRACVVCNYGVGVSNLLRESIQNAIPQLAITEILSYGQYQKRRREEGERWQLVISTLPIQEDQIPVITVPGILSENDLKQIRSYARRIMNCTEDGRETGSTGEHSLLKPALVFLEYACSSKRALLEFACTRLLKEGYITEDFLASVLEREEKISTEVGGGIAIPHGNPAFVQNSAILAIRLAEPMIWGDQHPVDIVFVLALKMNDEQLLESKEFFKILARILDDPQLQAKLRNAATAGEFISCINILK